MSDGGAAVRRRAAAHQLVDDLDLLELDEQSAHHLFRVLRVGDGDTVTVTDGAGRWRACVARGRVLEAISDVERVEHPSLLTVGVAIPKADRPEWVVQKLTELAIDRIVFLHSERSVVRWDAERAAKHVDKLGRVAVEALQQSRGVWRPEIVGPDEATAWLPRSAAAEPDGHPITDVDTTVLVGPEGGWTQAELAQAAGRVALPGGVLRVETAALAAAVQMATLRGN